MFTARPLFRMNLRLCAGVAAALFCLQLLVSGLAGAVLSSQLARGELIEVCTASGVMYVAADASDLPGEGNTRSVSALGDFCPFCPGLVGAPPLLLDALSYQNPTRSSRPWLPEHAQGARPVVPDLRHAPHQAPPLHFV
ncbi:MAG: DUF2946 family protein [Gammaproteobacteria bacterium]